MRALRAALGGLAAILLAAAVAASFSAAASALVGWMAPPAVAGKAPGTPAGRFWERPLVYSRQPAAAAEVARRRAAEIARAMPGQRGAPPASLTAPVGPVGDPNIAVGAALFQVPRVARATGLSPAYLRGLVQLGSARGLFNLGGPSYVNVLWLNRQVAAAVSSRH